MGDETTEIVVVCVCERCESENVGERELERVREH